MDAQSAKDSNQETAASKRQLQQASISFSKQETAASKQETASKLEIAASKQASD